MTEVTRKSAELWLAGYKSAWEQRDAAAAARLFTPAATYRETPFDAPFDGREAIEGYWQRAVSGQRDVAFSSELLACQRNEAIAHWHVAFKTESGNQPIELDGIFRLRFASEDLVDRFEEWWHLKT